MAATALRVGGSTRPYAQKVTLDPASVSANSISKETFTVTGVRLGQIYVVNAPEIETNLIVTGARATANNTLEITFVNLTGGAIDPASQDFYVVAL